MKDVTDSTAVGINNWERADAAIAKHKYYSHAFEKEKPYPAIGDLVYRLFAIQKWADFSCTKYHQTEAQGFLNLEFIHNNLHVRTTSQSTVYELLMTNSDLHRRWR